MAKSYVTVEFDIPAMDEVAGQDEEIERALRDKTAQITNAANAISSGFRTGYYHRNHLSPRVGGTQPVYEGDVIMGRSGNVGIVHPANYAAMLDNHRNNTLLKAGG